MAEVVITTARQRLREMTPDDAEALFELNADPEVVRYTGDAPHVSVDEARTFLASYVEVYRRDGFARWAAVDVATGAFLGWCGLRRQPGGHVDLGYRYRRAAWGRGLATEAARGCIEYGFGSLAIVDMVAEAHPENVRSLRVIQKLGFTYEGPSSFEGMPALRYRLAKERR